MPSSIPRLLTSAPTCRASSRTIGEPQWVNSACGMPAFLHQSSCSTIGAWPMRARPRRWMMGRRIEAPSPI
jgi:hypothetical protein